MITNIKSGYYIRLLQHNLKAAPLSSVMYSCRLYSDDKSKGYSSSDDEKSHGKKKPESKAAINRLNQLLASMKTDDNLSLVRSIQIPKPGIKKEKVKEEKSKAKQARKDNPDNIIDAAKNVARSFGGDTNRTESELLTKLLVHTDGEASVDTSQQGNKPSISLNELIVGMKVDRVAKSTHGSAETRSQYVKRALRRTGHSDWSDNQDSSQQMRRDRRKQTPRSPAVSTGSVNLFGSKPIGIFTEPAKLRESPDILETWNYLKTRDLKLAVTHPPSNYFEKMALWTEEGKIWKFPIDNEQGLEEEKTVYFADHVFLEQHLDSWCPTRGPVRHFMELVTVGLSKNPYITVQDKLDHINWFRDYFEQKKEILKEMIVDHPKNESKPIEISN